VWLFLETLRERQATNCGKASEQWVNFLYTVLNLRICEVHRNSSVIFFPKVWYTVSKYVCRPFVVGNFALSPE